MKSDNDYRSVRISVISCCLLGGGRGGGGGERKILHNLTKSILYVFCLHTDHTDTMKTTFRNELRFETVIQGQFVQKAASVLLCYPRMTFCNVTIVICPRATKM